MNSVSLTPLGKGYHPTARRWKEYHEEYLAWELLEVVKKLLLTNVVMR